MVWTKDIYSWVEGRTLKLSIPFTWLLPKAQGMIEQIDMRWDCVVVGGPGVYLMPEYLSGAEISYREEGILQRVNPDATRTTTGCPNKCGFCGIGCGKIEGGGLVELEDWVDNPVICDNNLLAASVEHFDRVCDRLEGHGWCDFEQGLDCRLLTEYHAERLARLRKPVIRLALDSQGEKDYWERAFGYLRAAGVAKRKIRSYVIVGFNSDVDEAWERCEWIRGHGVLACPTWYHALDCLELNGVTSEQIELGWSHEERTRLFGWYYRRRGTPRLPK